MQLGGILYKNSLETAVINRNVEIRDRGSLMAQSQVIEKSSMSYL